MNDTTELDPIEPAPAEIQCSAEVLAAASRAGRSSPLPLILLVVGVVLGAFALAAAAFRSDPWVGERLARLERLGLPPTLFLGVGTGLVVLSLMVLDLRRTEGRVAEAIDAALRQLPAPSAPSPDLPGAVAERFDVLGRTVESLRSTLKQIEDRTRKVTDGVEATYRSTEAIREQGARSKEGAGLARREDLTETRTALEEALRSIRTALEAFQRNSIAERAATEGLSAQCEKLSSTVSERLQSFAGTLGSVLRKVEEVPTVRSGVEGLAKTSVEERDASRLFAGEVTKVVELLATQFAEMSGILSAVARATGEIPALRASVERLEARLEGSARPAPPSGGGRRLSWEDGEPEPAPVRSAPSHRDAPADRPRREAPAPVTAGTKTEPAAGGVLDAIERLKSLRKPAAS